MRHYNIKSACRNLNANRFYSLLHILGLGVGIATAVFIFIWVKYERSFDQFNQNISKIYRVNNAYATSDGNNTIWTSSPAPLRKIALQNKHVNKCVRIGPDYGASQIVYQNKKIYDIQNETRYVDQEFFNFFGLPLIKGDAQTALSKSNSVVLSSSMAKKIFGDEDPVGKVVTLHGKDPFVVTGIASDMPANTSLEHIDIFLPITFIAGAYNAADRTPDRHTIDDDYGSFSYDVFISIDNNSHIKEVEDQITKVYLELGGPGVSGNLFELQSLETMHLIDEYGGRSTLHLVNAFIWIGLLIVLIACINYVNLSTARAFVRLKEVGVRKILGADKRTLMVQFLTETGLLLMVALVLAVLLFVACMPIYTVLTKQPSALSMIDGAFVLHICLIAVGAFLVTAIYPALLLSNFRPLLFMRGMGSGKSRKYASRRILVIFQFSISVIIIFAATIMIKQMHYIKTKDVGYNRSMVFTVSMPADMEKHSDAVIQQLQQSDAVASISTANADISHVSSSSGTFGIPGRSDIDLLFNDMEVAPGFLSALQMHLVKGRDFSGTAGDSSGFLLNQTAVKILGLKAPVGQEVVYHGRKGKVIGVVKDFNFESLKDKINPMIVYSIPRANGRHGAVLYVRAKAGALQQAISRAQQVYKKYAGDLPFKYDFLDQKFNSAYASFGRSLSLLNLFSLVAIIISGLGLFGLATYTTEVKTKEIGIRKVLGASKKDIIGLITGDFILLILLSTLIALPIGSWLMSKWLGNFAYRISINPWVFAEVILFMMIITWLIIGFKALQAASRNPVRSLKVE